MSDNYYYYINAIGEQAASPLTADAIVALVKSKNIARGNMAWCNGMDDWAPIESIPELQNILDQAPPPPPPPPPPPKKVTRRASSSLVADAIHWEERMTVDGVHYYYNSQTESVTWEKPDILKTDAERQESDGEWVWVSDPVEVWVPGRVKVREGNQVMVILMDKTAVSVTPSEDEPLWPLRQVSLNSTVDDMVMVDSLNQAQMVYLLKQRYLRDEIYTWVGASHTVLVSINPFKQLPIYTASTMAEFAHPTPNKLQPPHTFAIASSAFEHMRNNLQNQAILISGESGAGKTEATKQCFNLLAEIAGSESALEQKILNANPVLEAFGNAKTLRNNNSSRFGRWTAIHFSSSGHIIGALIENYLLEKSRVVHQLKGERNYHIFYQICECMAGPLQLESGPTAFRYLASSGCTKARGIDDAGDFTELTDAFRQLDFSDSDIAWVFETCAGILHLSNITFSENGEGSTVDRACWGALNAAARYLKVTEKTLSEALCHRTIEIRGEFNHILHHPKEAVEAADALSKAIYNEMFNWLVQRINASVEGSRGHFIGVLDIFGFEIFEKNSFEQLCINFTNEKLQQHFNTHTFKDEERVYLDEQVPYEPVKFIDNQSVLDLIEKKPYGLLNLLDEEVRLPKGDDFKWLTKVNSNQATHPNWLKGKAKTKTSFFVLHYAGAVGYESMGFCDKNRDSVFRDLYDLMSGADHPNFHTIFPPKDKNPRRVETLGGGFRKQLNNLMDVCNQTHPHYIRCIKPNDTKMPSTFNARMCLEQLTYAGVFEAVQIRKTGYPFRLSHERFAKRYCYLLKKKYGTVAYPAGRSIDEVCMMILESVPQDFSRVALGRTMMLYQAEEHRVLELVRNLCLDRIYSIAQRKVRRYIGKRFISAMKRVKSFCVRALQDGNDVALFDNAIELSEGVYAPYKAIYNFEPFDLARCRERRFMLQERADLNVVFQRLQTMDALEHFAAFSEAITRSDKIKDMPGSAADIAIETSVREKLLAAATAKLEPWAQEALNMFNKAEMRFVVQESAKYAYSSPTIVETIRLLEISDRIDPLAEAAYTAYDQAVMEAVIEDADAHAYSTSTIEEIKQWLTIAREIEEFAATALHQLSKTDMEGAIDRARNHNYNSPTMKEIQAALGLREEEFVVKQLKRAAEMGDENRRINREIRLKDLFLESHAGMFEFGTSCGVLRDPMEWATSKYFGLGFNKVELAESFLKHTETPIHQSLVQMADNKDAKEATKQFKNLLGYMGDRKYQYPDMLAVEFLNSAMEGSLDLQVEAYMQVMKQLSENPSTESSTKGWNMMSLILSCFPPSPTIENYVAVFINSHAPANDRKRYRIFLHFRTYTGVRPTPVTHSDLQQLLHEFRSRQIDEKYSEEDVVAPTAQPNTFMSESGAVVPSPPPSRPLSTATPVPPPSPSARTPCPAYEEPEEDQDLVDESPAPPPRPTSINRPLSMAMPQVTIATVLYDCPVSMEGTLAIFAGESVVVVDRSSAEWWAVKNSDEQTGWVPASYLKVP